MMGYKIYAAVKKRLYEQVGYVGNMSNTIIYMAGKTHTDKVLAKEDAESAVVKKYRKILITH